MYEPIGSEFLITKCSESQKDDQMDSNMISCENREQLLDGFLSEYLNTEKIREKDSLVEKLKYRHHQLELASKQMKKEKKKKENALALASGETSSDQKTNSRKRLVLNSKTRKRLKMYKLNKNENLDYSKYEKINKLWNSYANSCLMSCLGSENNNALSEENVLNCLKQLDYHGCYLTVVKSPSKSLIGLHGLVLQDKKNVFYMLTTENKIKLVPKLGALFEFELMDFCKMILVGSNICHRPEMRSTKHAKIKTKNIF
jgi:ribonuclease P protein subunit POP4